MIYKILKKYLSRKDILPEYVQQSFTNIITSSKEISEKSKLDIIFSLIDLHNKNRYIAFKKKVISSTGRKKIKWDKVIKKNLPIMIENRPLYLNLEYLDSKYHMEDPLLVIFYSVLFNLSKEHGMRIQLDEGLPIVKGHAYNRLEKGALKLLKRIRHNYFSDLHKSMIKLLLLYFNDEISTRIINSKEEILLTKYFHIIYEDMVDYLISDTEDLSKYKYHKDGKILDHIYHEKSLTSNNQTYFIGDSKYYSEQNEPSGESKYKQYTYVKNVIQSVIDFENSNQTYDLKIKIRDFVTEGYDVIPTFLISPFVENEYMNKGDSPIKYDNNWDEIFHFKNRLFDRDTIGSIQIKINLILLMNIYTGTDVALVSPISKKIKARIRKIFSEKYGELYDLYIISHSKLVSFIKESFDLFNGKVYNISEGGDQAVLALRKGSEFYAENNTVCDKLRNLGITLKSIEFN